MHSEHRTTPTLLGLGLRALALPLTVGLAVALGAPGVAGAQDEPAPDEEIIWEDGDPESKLHPTEEDVVARYNDVDNVIEVLPGYEDIAFESLLSAGVSDRLVDAELVVIDHPWVFWWGPQVVCDNYNYRVYKNAACNKSYLGYSTIYNNTWSGTSTVAQHYPYKRCGFCAGCGYCTERKNSVVGTYRVHDQYWGNGPIISTGEYRKNACDVF